MAGVVAIEAVSRGWRLWIAATLFVALGAASIGPLRAAAQDGEGESGAAPAIVSGGDGCFSDADTGQVAYCEDDVADTPPNGGLIPGVDGCLYYPGGGLAECPGGATPAGGGCIPMADGSAGCVIPGPVAGVALQPDPALPLDVSEEPGVVGGVALNPSPVVDQGAIEPAPAFAQPAVPAPSADVGSQAVEAAPALETTIEQPIARGAVPEVSGIHPFLAAERVRVAIAPIGTWIAAMFGWLLGV